MIRLLILANLDRFSSSTSLLGGSPSVEEIIYWLTLLIDTTVPIVGNASQRPHGSVGNDGDFNMICSVDYTISRIWAADSGRDRVGRCSFKKSRYLRPATCKRRMRGGRDLTLRLHHGIYGLGSAAGRVAWN